MMYINGYEEKLYREALNYLSCSAMVGDMHERQKLLGEAINIIDQIQRETRERNQGQQE